ncbi:MAG TPA: glycosyltransferase family 39 protein, partial [Aggregatilineales bacterium]|nr:glycosyltransferase family 39 protein [Aggregatilineales bacterium]
MIRRQLALIVALTLLAAGLRIYHLSRSPLDGDEAFAVRYWAASPTETLTTLAAQEPHPIGTFLLFWAWKSLVGGSEFAMRSLSMLINLFGVAAMFALAWHLFQDIRLASVGALLWAIDPFQIAHAQDARNYAIWASLSVLTLWLLVRAVDTNRRRDWALYAIAVTGGLYIFFAEVSVVAVHFFYLLIFRRRALRGWVITMLVVGI